VKHPVSDLRKARPWGFPRSCRIVKADEFSSIFQLRPVHKTECFTLHARPNRLAYARLGIVAAKRLAPRAVTRNVIKRIARELFRTATLPSVDYIVRLSKPVNTKTGSAKTSVLKQQLHSELKRIFMFFTP
jgi:ribonuclease P protein component